MQLSVIIINYNVKYFLEQCLCSVVKAMKNIEGEIIVIDNNSNDGGCAFLCNKFKEVIFIWNKKNQGFAKANNQALKIASGEYVLFLNPDTLVAEDCFEKCISFIHSKNNNIALGIKMIDGSGNFLKESKRAFPAPMTSLYKLCGLSRVFPRSAVFAKYHLGFLNENETHEVDVLAGAFMMVPKKILNIVGGFDEEFFMYGEDIDLSFRIQNAGFKNFYFAESCIIHFKGESTKKGSLNYVKMFYKAMSIFVRKHYGNTDATFFNFFIQSAIFLRAGVAVFSRILKWIGLPVIDASIILFSFSIIKSFWSIYIKNNVNYSPNMLWIAFPAFTILFLLSSWFSGLYDNGYKQSQLNRSTFIAILVLLSVYSLLPESLRFSRGILLFGSLTAFLFISLTRRFLLSMKIIEGASKNGEIHQTVIAGTAEEFNTANFIVKISDNKERVLGRIATGDSNDPSSIGNFKNLKEILGLHPVKEIIFCEGSLSFKTIIGTLPGISPGIRIRFFSSGSHTIIGSDDKDFLGEFVSKEEKYRLENAVYRRAKTFFDLTASLIFLLVFPIHFFTKKNPVLFFKKIFSVLSQKKTWVGYASYEKSLPDLKPGILSTTGLPGALNTLPPESLLTADKLYAQRYRVMHDLKLLWNNYRSL